MTPDPDDAPEGGGDWSDVTRSPGGWRAWSDVTRSDDRWSDDPVGWAMPMVCARHLRRAGAWMGMIAAVGGALTCLVLVVALWLLQASSTGSPTSAMRAGVLLFLAAQHGGVTLDGDTVRFLPLGLYLLAAVLPWRAGRAIAALADDRGERSRLRGAFVRMVLGYLGVVFLLALVGRVGTSHTEFLTTLGAAVVLVVVAGGLGARRELTRRDGLGLVPARAALAVRAAGAAALVTAVTSSLLLAGALAWHGGRVADLSSALGGGIGGLPVLLIGMVSAPNAVVAVSSLLAGPGFAVGTDTVLRLDGSRHGLLPSLPLLGGLPDGGGIHPVVIVFAALSFLGTGLAVHRVIGRSPSVLAAVRRHVAAGVVAALGMGLAALAAGGGLGTGRLRAIGASPWQAGLAFGAEVLVAGALVTAARAAARLVRVDDTELTIEVAPASVVDRVALPVTVEVVEEPEPVEETEALEQAEPEDAEPVRDEDDEDDDLARGA